MSSEIAVIETAKPEPCVVMDAEHITATPTIPDPDNHVQGSILEPCVTIQLANIPEILKAQDHWASFWVEWDPDRRKFDKRPTYGAKPNDASTLVSVELACSRMNADTALAYALATEKPTDVGLIVIDIDHCITDGKLNPAAERIVQLFAGTYMERSISRDGVHIFLYGKTDMNPNQKVVVDGTELDIEVYSFGRFIVMTGSLIEGGTPVILNRQDQLDALAAMKPKPRPTGTKKPALWEKTEANPDRDIKKLREALSFLDPTPYARWLKVGLALKRWGEEQGRMDESWQLFDEWSSRTEKDNYDSDKNQQLWESWFLDERSHPITIASIFHEAKEAGYNPCKLYFGKTDALSSGAAETLSDRTIILPSSKTPIIESARMIFGRLADTRRYFWRGGSVHDVSEGCLAPVRADAFRSRIEHLGPTIALVKIKDEFVYALRRPSKADCEALLVTLEAQTLPHVELIAESPMLFRTDDGIVRAQGGYCAEAKAYVLGEHETVTLTAEEAVKEITDLFRDFHFVTSSDKARALAFTLSIGLRLGGFIRDNRCPLFVIEADQSQTGKGTLIDMVASIYGERPALVGEKAGGVGGFDESIQQRLIDGKPIISFDNLRGKIASAYLEMLLTAPGRVGCRVPYRGEIYIDPHRFVFCATSNGMSSTKDLANRSVIIRLRKHASNYQFHRWAEGGLVEHVRSNRARLLAGVHAIIRQWYEAGAPEATVFGHDFRGWHRIAEAIVSMHWPELSAVIDSEHVETLLRISDPARSWLREVCQLVELGAEMSASEIAEICSVNDLPIPSCREDADSKGRAKAVGMTMGRLFGSEVWLMVDGFLVIRSERKTKRSDGEGFMPSKFYRFENESINDPEYELPQQPQ